MSRALAFPTCVGMNRFFASSYRDAGCVPHVRGDEPSCPPNFAVTPRRSPRTWGTLVLADAATTWCIRATAYGALERGYDLTLVNDAHTTDTMALDDGTSIQPKNGS